MLCIDNIDKLFSILSTENPAPKTELQYNNNYTMLVAVILSAQATDVSVNKATNHLFKIVKSPDDMLLLGYNKLVQYVRSIGLYKTKSKNIILMSKMLSDLYAGKVPDNFENLIKLPGVGRKTAYVVLNCAFDQPVIAVDTHVFRVSNRLGLVNESNVLNTEKSLMKCIPEKWLKNAHNWLVLHGRYICKAKKPECIRCKINKYCEYKNKLIS